MLRFYKKRNDDGLLHMIFGMSLIVFVASAICIGSYLYESSINRSKQEGLRNKIPNSNKTSENGELIDYFAEIRKQYPDLIGYLRIQNNNKINDLAVMHKPEKKDYYLYKDIDGNKSDFGTPYLDETASLEKPSDNFLIYAHNMKDLSQFGCLRHYKKKSYWEKYPTVNFQTRYDQAVDYEIWAAFYSEIYTVGYQGFKYYKFIDADNKEEFDDFVSNVKKIDLYETGITPEYGEQLLTMSTCDHTFNKDYGRFVLVARKKTGRTPGNSSGQDTSATLVPEETPTAEPTRTPTRTPTRKPTVKPATVAPTVEPTPTPEPTPEPQWTPDPIPEPTPTQGFDIMTESPIWEW